MRVLDNEEMAKPGEAALTIGTGRIAKLSK